MNHTSNSITRHLTFKYLLILALLGGLTLANYVILAAQIDAGRSVESVVRLSGRQQALLHRSALTAVKFALAKTAEERNRIRNDLLATAGPLEETHHRLIRKDAEVPPPASVRNIYFECPGFWTQKCGTSSPNFVPSPVLRRDSLTSATPRYAIFGRPPRADGSQTVWKR